MLNTNFAAHARLKFPKHEFEGLSFSSTQMPLLKFIMERHKQVTAHRPYRSIQKSIQFQDVELKGPSIRQERNMKLTPAEIELYRSGTVKSKNMVSPKSLENPKITITSFSKIKKKLSPPSGLNLSRLLKACMDRPGCIYTPQEVLKTIRELYNDGYITNPHTNNTQYPDEYDVGKTLALLADVATTLRVEEHKGEAAAMAASKVRSVF